MRVLIIFAHPDPTGNSFNHAILKTTVESLREIGAEVKVSDLYKMRFLSPPSASDFVELSNADQFSYQTEQLNNKFIPEIALEIEKTHWCDYLLFIGPIMWGTLFSPFHRYIERVFAIGHMYSNAPGNPGLLQGKKFMVITTTGAHKEFYQNRSVGGTLESRLLPLTLGCMRFCGFKVLRTQAFFDVRNVSQQTRTDWLSKWSDIVKHLDVREEISFIPDVEYDNGVLRDTSAQLNYYLINQIGDFNIDEAHNKIKTLVPPPSLPPAPKVL